jgi:UDP-N-acetylmuramoyl-L-alanyl-D-glutamate--2,6-diaminopimelate ligase
MITHSTANSKEVLKGSIFFARKGGISDGHSFVKTAIEKGAARIYYSSKLPFETISHPQVEFIFNKNLEESLPSILKEIYSLPQHLIGITGTNGKTSTAFLTAQALGMRGKKTGFIGTLGVFLCDGEIKKLQESELTTPDIISFYYYLALLKSKGAEVVCFEASSIGLFLGRLNGIKVEVACITNFTQDHLDFHKTMESYFNAKTLLFKNHLKENGLAIAGKNLYEAIKLIAKNTIHPKEFENIVSTPEGSTFELEGEKFTLNLAGKFFSF